jgi:hypothetical protein
VALLAAVLVPLVAALVAAQQAHYQELEPCLAVWAQKVELAWAAAKAYKAPSLMSLA